jgi:hypothetical protein
MARAAEVIPDDATVCRHILAPKMGADKDSLILSEFVVFERNDNPPPRFLGVSLAWTRYAQPVPNGVHAIGVAVEARRRARGRPAKYLGYVDTQVHVIRQFTSPKGRRFSVEDAPEEGDHHVEVRLNVDPGSPFPKIEKAELQLSLSKLFSPTPSGV